MAGSKTKHKRSVQFKSNQEVADSLNVSYDGAVKVLPPPVKPPPTGKKDNK